MLILNFEFMTTREMAAYGGIMFGTYFCKQTQTKYLGHFLANNQTEYLGLFSANKRTKYSGHFMANKQTEVETPQF